MTPMQVALLTERFLPFPPLHQSPTDIILKTIGKDRKSKLNQKFKDDQDKNSEMLYYLNDDNIKETE